MEEQLKEKPLYLSASKIKTFTSCSWQYFASYNLKIPQSGNSGASRGTVVHNLFELIAKPKHNHYIKKIWLAGSPEKIPAIKKFLEKQFSYEKLNKSEEVKPIKVKYGVKNNWESVCEMIMVTLKFEFIDTSNHKVIHSEYEFDIVNDSPKYAVRGFIDRLSEEDNGKTLKILDYKSSSKKFKGEDEDSNIQAMIYSLVARKIWKNYDKYKASFFFMRFPEDPYQHNEFSENELDGLEHYLEYITDILKNLNETTAKSNMASKDREKSWLCGRGKWVCPYRDELKFFKVKDPTKEGKDSEVSSHLKKEDAEEKIKKNKNWIIEETQYAGCPSFKTNGSFFP
jgi:ATP-dependent helicase/DNAse subunit B